MIRSILSGGLIFSALWLGGCGETSETGGVDSQDVRQTIENETAELISWEDLMPDGEDEILAELYAQFFAEQENLLQTQIPLSEAANEQADLLSRIDEGSAEDTMEQIGTYNVVEELNGKKVRLPGYVVPLDFNASFEYNVFLLVPYFGACLHTPPPPPNQIVFVTSEALAKVENINDPVWVEGHLKTGQFGSELGNSAYELTLSKLEPYEY